MPAITSLEFRDPPPHLINGDHVITAGFAGEDRPVHFRWMTDIGEIDIDKGVVTLVDGIGTASATWTAPSVIDRGNTVLEASYDPNFDDRVSSMIKVVSHDQLGILATQGVFGISASQIVATPVSIPIPGVAVSFAVKATGMGQLFVGIYSDNGSGPAALLGVGDQSLTVDNTLDFETITFTDPVPVSGRVWLAFLAKPSGTIQIANIANAGTPRSVAADGMPHAMLPDTFPSSVSNPDHYGMFVTVGPLP